MAVRKAKTKPSAGLSKEKKSAIAKKARAGKDIGKKGPGFARLVAQLMRDGYSRERAEKIAAAQMWKSAKR